jgi:hypothetical protein
MALRNRKQIPLCATCHLKLVHAGKYDGPALIKLAPNKLADNISFYRLRLLWPTATTGVAYKISVSNIVKPGKEYFSKSLTERGWRPKDQIGSSDNQTS